MDLKSSLAVFAGIAVCAACGGSHKLGDGNQPSESAGGADSGGAGGQSSQGGDPGAGGGSLGGDPGVGGAQFGGQAGVGAIPGGGGVSYGGVPGGGGVSYGGVPGGGGVSYGGDPGVAGGSFGGSVGAGGQYIPNTGGYPPQSTPGIDVTGVAGSPGSPGIDGGAGAPGNDLVHVWTGYVENHTFKSGSDALLLDITQQSAGELTGHITFGDASLPLSTAADLVGPAGMNAPDVLWQPLEGFSYTAMNGKVVGTRLEFDVAPLEAWNSVCTAQTQSSCTNTAWDSDGVSQCFSLVNGQRQPGDCGVMELCLYSGCACDPTGCFANTGIRLIHLDVALRNPYLDGSVAGLNETSVLNVHFTR